MPYALCLMLSTCLTASLWLLSCGALFRGLGFPHFFRGGVTPLGGTRWGHFRFHWFKLLRSICLLTTICVLILLDMRLILIYVPSDNYIWSLRLLYRCVCPQCTCEHATIYPSWYYYVCVLILVYFRTHTTVCVLILLYMTVVYGCSQRAHCTCYYVFVLILVYFRPHTAMCVLILLYVCSQRAHCTCYYVCVLILVYFRPHTAICVLILLYMCVRSERIARAS
jgi:hypothetical protein